nr:MAG TPA: hypothetical protein [Caudoviricetes sp.]
MEIKIKQSKLNEAIIGNCNMEVPEGNVETKGNVPEVYADAINQRREREKKITDDFKEQDKAIEEFAKESQKTENKLKGTPEMKKLHLSESLFEDVNKSITEKAQDAAGSIEEFINIVDKTPGIEEFIEKEDIETLRRMIDKLMDFYHKYSTTMDNENVFEAVETPVDTKIYYKKKRGPLVAIIEDELGSGEVVYKLGKSGKYNPTHAPSLNIDRYLIGGGTDEKGEYISAWIPENKIDDAVAIAKKYNKEYKLGHDKYVRGDKDFIRIYIDESDWEGNYVDPNVPTLNRKG